MRSLAHRRRGRAEEGYNLVILVMAITVLNILVAASLPMWSTMIQREKEEELIFRGLQYAEAIRVFHNRFQRYPNRLEELVEIKPRSIRQLWKDPMTEDGKWQLIFDGQPPNPVEVKDPNDPNGRGEDTDNGKGQDSDDDSSFGGPESGEKIQIGPIIGVKSRSSKASVLVFFGRERYDEWQFTEPMILQVLGGSGPRVGGDPTPRSASVRWLGRPLPSSITGPGGTEMPADGSGPGGMEGFNDPGRPGQRNPGQQNPGQRNPAQGGKPQPPR